MLSGYEQPLSAEERRKVRHYFATARKFSTSCISDVSLHRDWESSSEVCMNEDISGFVGRGVDFREDEGSGRLWSSGWRNVT